MVNSTNQPPEEAIQTLFKNVSREERERILKDLINAGGLSLDHESLRVSGAYAHAARVMEGLEAITDRIPTLLDAVWQTQNEREAKLISTFNKLLSEAQAKNENIAMSINASCKNLESVRQLSPKRKVIKPEAVPLLVSGLIGFVVASAMVGTTAFLLYPLYLQQARGGDADILKWLATNDGKVMMQSFKSGNKSVKDCVKQVIKKSDGNNRLICEIAID